MSESDYVQDYSKFIEIFDVLVENLKEDLISKNIEPEIIVWYTKSLYYNVLGGKLNRGLIVLQTVRHLVSRPLTDSETFKASVLGWCVELLQASFLVVDDIMDHSVARRGKPCWYCLPEVGLNAINDSFMLEMSIYILLKRYFEADIFYIKLLELYLQVSWKTELGQLHDLITSPECKNNFSKFTLKRYQTIVKYKTAYYSFYLPVAQGLIMCGVVDSELFKKIEFVLLKIGEIFQIQDDYLDCYGDPNVTGKIGTDIEDNKCTWLIIQALQKGKDDQLIELKNNYGKKNKDNVQQVKKIYDSLNIQELYLNHERQAFEEIKSLINTLPTSIPKKIVENFVQKISFRVK